MCWSSKVSLRGRMTPSKTLPGVVDHAHVAPDPHAAARRASRGRAPCSPSASSRSRAHRRASTALARSGRRDLGRRAPAPRSSLHRGPHARAGASSARARPVGAVRAGRAATCRRACSRQPSGGAAPSAASASEVSADAAAPALRRWPPRSAPTPPRAPGARARSRKSSHPALRGDRVDRHAGAPQALSFSPKQEAGAPQVGARLGHEAVHERGAAAADQVVARRSGHAGGRVARLALPRALGERGPQPLDPLARDPGRRAVGVGVHAVGPGQDALEVGGAVGERLARLVRDPWWRRRSAAGSPRPR